MFFEKIHTQHQRSLFGWSEDRCHRDPEFAKSFIWTGSFDSEVALHEAPSPKLNDRPPNGSTSGIHDSWRTEPLHLQHCQKRWLQSSPEKPKSPEHEPHTHYRLGQEKLRLHTGNPHNSSRQRDLQHCLRNFQTLSNAKIVMYQSNQN